jgi:hypothetical protein
MNLKDLEPPRKKKERKENPSKSLSLERRQAR